MKDLSASQTANEIARRRMFAMALCDLDEIEPARMVLEDALDTRPGDLDVLGDLAAVYLRGGRWDECIRAASDVLADEPDDDESAYALAMALGARGRLDEALQLHRELADGARAQRFASRHPELSATCRSEIERLLAATPDDEADPQRPEREPRAVTPATVPVAIAATHAPQPLASTRFTGAGAAKYQLDHLDQKADQLVGGPIQDDEALMLYALVRTMRMRRVLEVGGLSGYSARNFLAALGDDEGTMVYTVDIDPVASQAANHVTITKDCGLVTPDELHRQPLDMIFFDAHALEPQIALLDRLDRAGMISAHAVIALHDTDLHPRKSAPWAYALVEDGHCRGYVHQAVERRMVNRLRERGWDALCLHMDHGRSDARLPLRHGLTLMQRFRTLET